ncbi:hypothetical protein EDB83DRAFT_2537415 [Lactarius deliciosus]|nr:hypothetical protein EDB83DRAFT_2537415 [Lactarius deliciosus]
MSTSSGQAPEAPSYSLPVHRPDAAALLGITTAGATSEARALADCLNPQRIGYEFYLQKDRLRPLKGGVVLVSEDALNAAFDVVATSLCLGFDVPGGPQLRALSSGDWYRGAALTLSAVLRGTLVSNNFYGHADGLPIPDTQRGLIIELCGQLLAELTALGETRLNREELWRAVSHSEREALAQLEPEVEERRGGLTKVLKDLAVEDTFTYLIDELEREGLSQKKAKAGAHPIREAQWTEEAVAAQRSAAIADAERQWRQWKETELAKARTEALARVSKDDVLRVCGDDAALLVEEKKCFAKDYVAANYQTWVDRALDDIWPTVEADTQKISRGEFFRMEFDRTYPDVRQEVAEHVERFKGQLTRAAEKTARGDLVLDSLLAESRQGAAKSKGKAKSNTAAVVMAKAKGAAAGSKRTASGLIPDQSSTPSDIQVVKEEFDAPMTILTSSPIEGDCAARKLERKAAELMAETGIWFPLSRLFCD